MARVHVPENLRQGARIPVRGTVLTTWWLDRKGHRRLPGAGGVIQWVMLLVPIGDGTDWYELMCSVPADLRPVKPGDSIGFNVTVSQSWDRAYLAMGYQPATDETVERRKHGQAEARTRKREHHPDWDQFW